MTALLTIRYVRKVYVVGILDIRYRKLRTNISQMVNKPSSRKERYTAHPVRAKGEQRQFKH